MLTQEQKEFATKIDDGKDILEYKGTDWKTLEGLELLKFCKANKSFGEPGLSAEEVVVVDDVVKKFDGRPITIVETGMCFGVTTRYFIIRNIKYGGELNTFEIQVRPKFKAAMEELGLWDKINVLGHSMTTPWDKRIQLLFIDSEHAMSDALGEYMRFRVYLDGDSIVGFHDSDSCWGVRRAIEIANEIDELEMIGRVEGRMSAGITFFRIKGLGEKQAKLNKMHQDEEVRKIQESQLRVA